MRGRRPTLGSRAAAPADLPIKQVHIWLTDPTEDAAAGILMDHGLVQTANAVQGVINLHDKQRGGIYRTALQMASCLPNRQVSRWVTPQGPADDRPQFDSAKFVRSKGTLQPLQGRQGTRRPSGHRPDGGNSGSGRRTCRPLTVPTPRNTDLSASSMRQGTSAGGVSSQTSTATTAPAASS